MNEGLPPRQRSLIEIFGLRKPSAEEAEYDQRARENPARSAPGTMTPGTLLLVIIVGVVLAILIARGLISAS